MSSFTSLLDGLAPSLFILAGLILEFGLGRLGTVFLSNDQNV